MSNTQHFSQEELRNEILNLRLKHRGLDEKILLLETNTYTDHLEIRRLKQHKLRLKDTIQRMESQLIPDLNA